MAVTNMNILLVEDDPFLQEGLKMLLVRERFTVHQARSIQDARTKFAEPIHLLILDIGLPDGNGFDFCRDVRQEKPELPILFLTARDEEYDVVRGFECGADDYIAKPFRSLELIARIRALLRRFSPDDMSGGDDLQLNRSRLQVRVRNEVIQLTPTEFLLLEKLLTNKGRILTREQLLASLWDMEGQFTEDNTLSVHIFRLREKIGHEAIETIRGVGYCWRGLAR